MLRVAKPGALIIIADEGLSPKRKNSIVGKLLLKENKIYGCKPPKSFIPISVHAKNTWIYRDTFYLTWFYNNKQ